MSPPAPLNYGWTGGQWTLLRIVVAATVAATLQLYLVQPLWREVERILFALGLVVTIPLAIGWQGRIAARLLLAVVLVGGLLPYSLHVFCEIQPQWILDRQDFGNANSLWLLAAPLAFHVAVSRVPYGSIDACGRVDPSGAWALSGFLLAVSASAWGLALGVLALTVFPLYLIHPAWLLVLVSFALLPASVFWRPLVGPAVWLLFSASATARYAQAGYAVHAATVALLSLHAFRPAWIPPLRAASAAQVFYDGDCGLCHGAVRFVLAEDTSGTAFRFAPIGGAAWRAAFPTDSEAPRNTLVVLTADGRTLLRSAAALHIQARLGGLWRALSGVLWLVPRTLRDLVYRSVAGVRRRLFEKPVGACPLVPDALRERFDLTP